MEATFGIVGKDFVLFAADAMAGRSIMVYTDHEEKMYQVAPTALMSLTGPQGDRVSFGEYIKANVTLHELNTGAALSQKALANYTRGQLAEALRSDPKQVNVLLGGVDKDTGLPALYYMDYLASMSAVPFGVHGHASNFCLSILDRHWKAGMTLPEALALLGLMVRELRVRYLVNFQAWRVRVATAEGVKDIDFAEVEKTIPAAGAVAAPAAAAAAVPAQ